METTLKIKTIDVQAKQWFDKVNGNSYFSAIITLNFGLKNQKQIGLPFQYGYGSQYEYEAMHVLQTENYLPTEKICSLYQYCNDNKIILRTNKKDKCLKSEVKEFIKYL